MRRPCFAGNLWDHVPSVRPQRTVRPLSRPCHQKGPTRTSQCHLSIFALMSQQRQIRRRCGMSTLMVGELLGPHRTMRFSVRRVCCACCGAQGLLPYMRRIPATSSNLPKMHWTAARSRSRTIPGSCDRVRSRRD